MTFTLSLRMFLRQFKKLAFSIILLLAMLQALLPLLHAHPAGTPAASMGAGLHLHETMTGYNQAWHAHNASLQVDHDHLQVIGVGSANEPEPLTVADLGLLLAFVLVALGFSPTARSLFWHALAIQPAAAPAYFLSPLRAPPLH